VKTTTMCVGPGRNQTYACKRLTARSTTRRNEQHSGVMHRRVGAKAIEHESGTPCACMFRIGVGWRHLSTKSWVPTGPERVPQGH